MKEKISLRRFFLQILKNYAIILIEKNIKEK